jgi:hypothetical protein
MLIIDKIRRREPKAEILSLGHDLVESGQIDSRKIIDFESARQAFERDRLTRKNREESKRTFFSNLRPETSSGVAESLVTIVLVLAIGLSLLLGLIWGF